MKVCPTYGPGFFYIPGSDTCLKVGGNVWFETIAAQRFKAANDLMGYRTQLKVDLDARQNTEFGLLRTVVSPRVNSRLGAYTEQSGTADREGIAWSGTNTGGAAKQTQVNVVGYIQLGGLTVGRLASFAQPSFYATSNISYEGTDVRDEVDQVAYTLSLGNGMSLTGAIEDGSRSNRNGIFSTSGGKKTAASSYTVTSGTPIGTATATNLNALYGVTSYTATSMLPLVSYTDSVGTVVNYGAITVPDAVMKFGIDQAWGKAELSGILHTINYDTHNYNLSTEYGYGVNAAMKINLPMISAGDYLWLNGTYAEGFTQQTFRNITGDRNSNDTTGLGFGRMGVTLNDVLVNETTKETYLATSYGVAGEFGHYFTPQVLGFVGASYSKLDWSSAARLSSATTLAGATAINPISIVRVNAGVQWQPIKNFKVQPEVTYIKSSADTATNAGITTEGPAKKNESMWAGRVRVTRDF